MTKLIDQQQSLYHCSKTFFVLLIAQPKWLSEKFPRFSFICILLWQYFILLDHKLRNFSHRICSLVIFERVNQLIVGFLGRTSTGCRIIRTFALWRHISNVREFSSIKIERRNRNWFRKCSWSAVIISNRIKRRIALFSYVYQKCTNSKKWSPTLEGLYSLNDFMISYDFDWF